MGDAVGAGKKCSSEVLMEDPADSVAETNQQMHGHGSTSDERTLNWRDMVVFIRSFYCLPTPREPFFT
jgi:hypothetical protein